MKPKLVNALVINCYLLCDLNNSVEGSRAIMDLLLTSSEQEVLKVIYCDRPLSNVHCLSVNILFSVTNWTMRMELYMKNPFKNSFKFVLVMQNSGFHGNQKRKREKSSASKHIGSFWKNIVGMFLG